MGTTVEQPTQQWAPTQTATVREDPAMAPELFRVVLDGTGPRTGTIASDPHDRATAQALFDKAVQAFATAIAAGELRISVLSEQVWAQRATPAAGVATPAAGTR
jgi:hypothetical protein